MTARFKALLIYPNLQMVNLVPPNISILSAYLKEGGVDVKVFDTTLYRTKEKSVDEIRVEHMQLRQFNLKDKGVDYKSTDVYEDFKKLVSDYKPGLIGVSATDDTYELGMALISKLENKSFHVTVGGIYPTFAPEEVIKNENVDSICIGEGEEALLELCNALRDGKDPGNIKNLWVKRDGNVRKNGLRRPIDINNIPYEDFSVFEEKRLFRPMQGKIYRMVPISPDRGCPFVCTFCAAPLITRLYKDECSSAYFRTKSIQRIVGELKHHTMVNKADYIYFNSETFFARKDAEMEEIAEFYSRSIGLPFWCQSRVDTITEARAGMLKKMNCDRISIGIEHGNEKFRKKILKKNFTNEQVIETFRILERHKIAVTVNNIVGFPDETRALAFDTINLNRRIKADSINAYFFVPYRGTPLREYCLEKGYIHPDTRMDSLHGSSALTMPQFGKDEIKGLIRTFPLYVKMPESYFDRIAAAEKLDSAGDKAFAELREIYFREYFK